MGKKKDLRKISEKIIIDEIKTKIQNKLHKNMNIIELLEIICKEFNSKFQKCSKGDLIQKIIAHSYRVYLNALTIIKYLNKNEYIEIDYEDMEVLTISIMFHDIGKVFNEDNHEIYSEIIVKYLLKMDSYFSEEKRKRICKMILNHSHKRKKKDKIDIFTKILRDADTLDEQCGDSLYVLAITHVKNEKKNLNHITIKNKALQIIRERNDYNYINDIKSKINIPSVNLLYEQLLQTATNKFYNYIYGIEDVQTETLNKYLKYRNCLKINIK